MITALALGLSLASPSIGQDSPRLKTLLANGAVTLVERMPSAKTLSVQLFAGVRGVAETRKTHGWRHLLEHLTLKGKDGTLDERLEAQGVFFVGRTYRDALQVEFTAKPDKLEVILKAVDEILAAPAPTAEGIAHEVAIMRQEFALQGDFSRLSRTAYAAAFEDTALDPFGDLDAMAAAAPAELSELRAKLFAPQNLVVVVSGNVELKPATDKLKQLLEERGGPSVAFGPSRKGEGGRREADDAFGEMRGAIVDGLADTGPVLCAGFALAARLDNGSVSYTPTSNKGLVLVGRTDANNTVGLLIDNLTEVDEAALFGIGRVLADRWITGQLASPSGSGYLRGMLLAQGSARPEELQEAVRTCTWPQFRAAIDRFRKARAAIAVGVRP